MGSILIIGLIGLVVILVSYNFYKNFKKGKNIRPLAVKDAQAEILYKQKKNKEEKTLTLQEKMELSWEFLYKITEKVLNQFSPADRQEVHEIGKKLSSTGMKYVHVIELGIQEKVLVSPGLIEQEKDQSKTR